MRRCYPALLVLPALLLTGCARAPQAELNDATTRLTKEANSRDAPGVREAADDLIALVNRLSGDGLPADEVARIRTLAEKVKADADRIDPIIIGAEQAAAQASAAASASAAAQASASAAAQASAAASASAAAQASASAAAAEQARLEAERKASEDAAKSASPSPSPSPAPTSASPRPSPSPSPSTPAG